MGLFSSSSSKSRTNVKENPVILTDNRAGENAGGAANFLISADTSGKRNTSDINIQTSDMGALDLAENIVERVTESATVQAASAAALGESAIRTAEQASRSDESQVIRVAVIGATIVGALWAFRRIRG